MNELNKKVVDIWYNSDEEMGEEEIVAVEMINNYKFERGECYVLWWCRSELIIDHVSYDDYLDEKSREILDREFDVDNDGNPNENVDFCGGEESVWFCFRDVNEIKTDLDLLK